MSDPVDISKRNFQICFHLYPMTFDQAHLMIETCLLSGSGHSDRDVAVGRREGRDPDCQGSTERGDRLRRHRRVRKGRRHHQLRVQKRGQRFY